MNQTRSLRFAGHQTHSRRATSAFGKPSSVLVILGLVLVIDQMLLPMFHPLGIPFKLSYAILVAIPFLLPHEAKSIGRHQRFWAMTRPIMWIAVFGCLGQLYLLSREGIFDLYALFKQVMTYALMVLAFYLGQHIPRFELRWILWVLYGSICLVLLLSVAADRVPALARLWWQSDDRIELRLAQNQLRPTPFGDGSMIGTTLLFLFVVVSIRLGFLRIEKYHMVISTALTMLTALILMSRNQMVAIAIIGIALVLSGSSRLLPKILLLTFVLIGCIALITQFGDAIRQNSGFIDRAFQRLERTDLLALENQGRAGTILRPLLHWERFRARFLVSPIWGTGFSKGGLYPFDAFKLHNDWFYVWASSGALGGIALFVWMFRIYKELGLLVLLPFVLPGLTNSFLLFIAGVIVYCFMLGVLIERRHLSPKGNTGLPRRKRIYYSSTANRNSTALQRL